jgi:hypothetical protein
MSPADKSTDQSESSYANNAMTRLWRNAEDRETGAEAVEAIRARRQAERESDSKNPGGGWRFRRTRSQHSA